jgi:hypothetical protein
MAAEYLRVFGNWIALDRCGVPSKKIHMSASYASEWRSGYGVRMADATETTLLNPFPKKISKCN